MSAKVRQDARDFHRCPRGFGATIDFIAETTFAGLILTLKTEHHVDHRHGMFNCNALKCIGNGPAQILCMIRFSLQNHAAGNDRIGSVLRCQFAHDHRNFERSRHAVQGNRCFGCKRA
jgi:hypothetical protein